MTYLCPLCYTELEVNQRSYTCENHHQFDMAKEGYVNLMPVQHKRSKDPGDNKEMMQARRRFLEADHYHPMREAISQLLTQYMPVTTPPQILDIGCGEGYYTDYFHQALLLKDPTTQVFGLDISKIAIRYAAKRYPNCQFSVASSHRLPFANESLHAIIRIYAPCKPEELLRVLSNQGIVITATPAGRHLYQLKELIYQDVQLHDESPESLPGFTMEKERKLNYSMTLSGQEADDLLQMTPFAWRASEIVRSQLIKTAEFECEADFMLRVYRKNN